ncbi:MAG: hypothetical protein Q9176_008114 [Flavoplaca citrina]
MTPKSKSILVTVASFLFTCISSLTLEIPPQIIANALSRSPNLRGPPIPYGFSMRIVQDPDKPLNVDDLYICAIEAMYHWAAEGYEEETLTHNGQSEIVRGLQVSYYDKPNRPINIHWKHIILAILVSLNSMDQRHVFAESVVELKQHERVFGLLRIGKPSSITRGIEASGGSTNTTTQISAAIAKKKGDSIEVERNDTEPTVAINSNTSTSKIITTNIPELGTANITYQHLGTSVSCTLLFSTALDGIAYAATDDSGDTWPFSTTYDWSNKMMYQTVQVLKNGGSEWNADLIKRVARLLPLRMFADDECGEVRFRVEVRLGERVERVGTGTFQRLDF